MSQFLDSLCIAEVDDKIFQVYDHPFRYASDLQGLITVPIGFYTDFASVPRWMPLMYALVGDTAHAPAVIHDWLYYSAFVPNRKDADLVLLEAMRVWGMSAWRCQTIYWGVRLGGWAAWNNHRRNEKPKLGKFKASPDIVAKPARPR